MLADLRITLWLPLQEVLRHLVGEVVNKSCSICGRLQQMHSRRLVPRYGF